MTSDLRIQGEVVVNSEQAESAFNRVGDKAQQMANEVSTSANKAGQAVDKIGDGAGASAEKFTRAESRISASIKRATNELELLGKTASQRLEFNISDKGLDPKKFEPMLQRLRELEAQALQAQRAATGSLDKMGISAAQTAAALRGVPAQFTDIVTSLQGGQAPLTVFLQQGGQLKDMFGGAGNAARALGGYVLGLINPFTLAAAAVGGLGLAYAAGSKEADGYRQAIVLTGNAAGLTIGQMQQMAQQIGVVTGSQREAAGALATFATSGKVSAENLRQFTQAAVEFARVTGQSVDEVAKNFADLANDPLKATLKLNDSMNFLTESIFRQIQSLQEQGRETEAANVAQRAYADTLNERKDEIIRNLGAIEKAWAAIKKEAGFAMDAFLDIGRVSTLENRLQKAQNALQSYQNTLPGRRTTAQVAAVQEFGGVDGLQREIAGLQDLIENQRKSAQMERERAVAVKASGDLAQGALKYETDLEKQRREVLRATQQYETALTNQNLTKEQRNKLEADYIKLVSGVTAVKEKTGRSNTAAENKELRDQLRVFADLAGVSSTYYNELANYQKQRAAGVITEQQYVQAVEALIKKQPFAVAIAKEQADATKAQAKASEEAAKAHLKYVESFAKGANAAQQQADQLRTEEAAAAIAADGYYSLAQAIELVTIARLQEQQQGLLGNEEAYLAVQKEIDARKELVGLIGSKEARKAAEDSAKDAAREWDRAAADINRSLTDALLRGFESGKGFAKNFVDTMKNLFSTLVLRPIISAIVSPVAGAITGALGLAGTANAGTSALGTVGNLASGARLLGGLGAFGGGLSGGFGGLLGSLGLSATGSTLGGALSAGSIALQSGNILGGLGTFAGALGPLALGIGALTSLLGSFKGETRTGGQFGVSFDGTVTNQRRDQVYTYQGQQFDRDFSNGQRNALIAGQAYRLEGDPVQNEQAIRDAVSGTASGINAFLKALGSKATLTGFSAGLETSSKGRGGVFAGGILSDGTTFGESGKGDNYAGTLYEKFSTNSPDFKTALENFTLDLKQSTIQALQSVTDIPETVKKMLKGVDAEGLSEEAANALLESINAQIVGVQNLTTAFEAMGLDKLAEMGFDAAAGLAAAAGGFDKLQTNLNTYYDNFYTDEEKRANLQKQVDKQFAELGIDVPKNRDEFRRLVEGTLEQVDVQEKARASLSKQINDAVAGAGKDGFTLADAAGRSIVSGINPALLGDGPADPALAGKLNGFLAGVSDLAAKGLDPEAFDKGLAGLIDVNAEVLGIGKDASKTAATLLALSGTFAQLNESADEAAARIAKEQADARDKALRGLERAIDAEKKALQSQIDVAREVADTMSGLFDLLKTNVQELYGEVDSTRAMLAVQGNDFITQALATARTTGYLPDQTQLADAISAARGGLDSSGYASQFELDRDRLVLAGKLSELEGLTGKQLTSAELTVRELESQSEQLDQTLEYWKQQIEIANGTYEATLSVTEAIKNLESLMFPKKGDVATNKPGMTSGGGSWGPTWGGASNTSTKYQTPVGGYTGGTIYAGVSLDQEKRLDKYAAGYHAFDGTGDAAGLNKWIADNKLTPEDLAGLSGLYESDWERWYKANNIPAFAVGTNYVPRDMLAQIHEGEAIVPKAYNPAANPGMGGGNDELVAEVRALREAVAALQAAASETAGNTRPLPQLGRQFDTYSNGGQFSRQKAMA